MASACVVHVDGACGGYVGDAAAVLTTKIVHRMALAKIFFVWRAWTQHVRGYAGDAAAKVGTTKIAHHMTSAKIFFVARVDAACGGYAGST